MARRVSLPSADDLFRATTQDEREADDVGADTGSRHSPRDTGERARRRPPGQRPSSQQDVAGVDHQPSGRVRHDEKVTVYVTAEELFAIESARLTLRSSHALAVDRGRLVREAVAMALAELEAEGEASRLVRRLREE